MKKNSLIISALFASKLAFASDSFICTVSAKVTTAEPCTICTSSNGDGECNEERASTCLVQKSFDTDLVDSVLHPSESFILGSTKGGMTFIFGLSKSGYSASLRSERLGVDTSTQSTKTLNPWYDDFSLSAKTKFGNETVGKISELILNCRPL